MDKENLSNILDEIKNRFSSRFITFFIIYWLIFHWQITVALLWYDRTQIKAEGCKSIFEFISNQLINNNHWLKSFFYAIGSTFIFPIIKAIILVFDSKIIVCRKNFISKIRKDEYFNRIITLQNKIELFSDVNVLNGDWEFYSDNLDKNKLIPITFRIKNGLIYYHANDKFDSNPSYKIKNFFMNDKEITFTKVKSFANPQEESAKGEYSDYNKINFLNLKDNIKIMDGFENGKNVKYIKIS